MTTAVISGKTKASLYLLVGLAILLFAVRNLPWHLDNYDQARQAYAALDVVLNGHWLFQELPYGGFATKPPLTAWLQAACFYLTGGNWDLAWRLPSFAAAITLLLLMYRQGLRMGGALGAALAIAALAFNMLSIRIATLVRTDMLLALLSFLPGLFILNHVEQQRPWTARDAGWFMLMLFGAVFTKGHTVYAFLLPGLAAYGLIQWKRHEKNNAWPGFLPLLIPILLLVAALGWACWHYPDFYEQIVVGEMAVAFQSTGAGDENQPFFYYMVHLLHKWAPWSLLLILLAGSLAKRMNECWKQPGFVWLVCWSLGGLLTMSLIPDKRVDRIFPVIPPLTLLLVFLASFYDRATLLRMNYRRFIIGLVIIGACLWTAYGLSEMGNDMRRKSNALRAFSGRIANRIPADRLGVAGPLAEGFLCYFRITEDLSPTEAEAAWKAGALDALILSQAQLTGNEPVFAPYQVLDQVQDPFNEESYLCIIPAPKKP